MTRPNIRLVDSRATVRFLQYARPLSRVERLGRYLDTRDGLAAVIVMVILGALVVTALCVNLGMVAP